jgi:hypothetical protein
MEDRYMPVDRRRSTLPFSFSRATVVLLGEGKMSGYRRVRDELSFFSSRTSYYDALYYRAKDPHTSHGSPTKFGVILYVSGLVLLFAKADTNQLRRYRAL